MHRKIRMGGVDYSTREIYYRQIAMICGEPDITESAFGHLFPNGSPWSGPVESLHGPEFLHFDPTNRKGRSSEHTPFEYYSLYAAIRDGVL